MTSLVLDIETQRLVDDWHRPWDAGLACCCVWVDGLIRIYGPNDTDALATLLKQHAAYTLVTWNGNAFDIPLLTGLGVAAPSTSCDLAAILREATGRRWKLEDIARSTLGKGKGGHGKNAPQLWQEGRLAELHAYCLQDVEVTRELFLFAQRYGYLVAENKAIPIRVPDCTAGPRDVCEPPSKEPATAKQIAFIRSLYAPTPWNPPPGLTKHQASGMIDQIQGNPLSPNDHPF